MSKIRYVDIPAIVQVIGCVYNLGVEKITTSVIEDYLQQKPKKMAVYKNYDGTGYLTKAVAICQPDAFNYYYHKMKKMTLLRMYNERAGLDLAWLYDINNIFDQKKKQRQEEWLEIIQPKNKLLKLLMVR